MKKQKKTLNLSSSSSAGTPKCAQRAGPVQTETKLPFPISELFN